MRRAAKARNLRNLNRSAAKTPRNRRKPNYALLLGLFAVAAAVSAAASFALQTPWLVVKEVKIHGVRLTDRAEVERAAKAALGRNILLLRKRPLLARIGRLHEVAQVTLGRSFPDRVWLEVRERSAVAVLTDASTFCLIQRDGLAFHLTKGPVRGMPTLEVADCGPMREGRKCLSRGVATALEALRCARQEGIPVAKISVDRVGDMCLNMEGRFYVKLGQAEDIARKMSILRNALVYKPSIAREAEYIDLSCPSAPVWKAKSLAGAAS